MSKLNSKWMGLFCLSMLLLMLISGCAKEKKTYKVGAIFAITGSASWLGEPEKKTAEMIKEEINAAGGINGHLLDLIIEDTVGDETKTVNAVNKLIEKDKVLAIIGPSRSGTTMAIVPIVEKAEVPLVSCAAAEAIVSPVAERHWVFKTPQKDTDAVIRIYEHMQDKEIAKIAIITGTTGFGDQGRKQLKKYAEKMEITIVADETYGPGDTDMTPQLIKIKGTNAQAIVNWSIVPAQSIVPKNMRQLGMTIPLYQSHGFGNIKYAAAAGEAGEGIIFPAGRLLVADVLPEDHPQKTVLTEYKKAYEEKYREPVSTFGGHAYDALKLVIVALQQAGPDRAKIRDELENIKGFVGTGGIFNFSPEDHSGLTKEAFEMLTVKEGNFTLTE